MRPIQFERDRLARLHHGVARGEGEHTDFQTETNREQALLSKRLATRWEVRDYRFSTGNGTSRVSNDNIEFTLGTAYLF